MAAADVAPVVESVIEFDRTIDDRVLAPISGPKPAGEDTRNQKLWVELRSAKPKLIEGDDSLPTSEWERYAELLEETLRTQSKDLELGVFLTEARARTHGFAGARDGFRMLSGLVEKFAEQGLFPEIIEGDIETQYSPLYWINDKFPDVLRELELTRSPELPNYSLNYLIEANSPHGGLITKAQWDKAAIAGGIAEYQKLLDTIEEALAELNHLRVIVGERYGAGSLSFGETKEALELCRNVVQGFLRRTVTDDTKPAKGLAISSLCGVNNSAIESGVDEHGAWADCERLARSGQIDQALSQMVSLAASEPNGRVRFQRKLLLADLCLQTNRKQLGTSILQELNELIEKHRLMEWETTELVGGVWSRLVRCYRDRTSGTANEALESDFYLKLSRLDPWQALTCGEPARRE